VVSRLVRGVGEVNEVTRTGQVAAGAGSDACVVCGADAMRHTVTRDRLPAMQNFVYRQQDLAERAPRGRFDLALCGRCGFARNAAFDPALLTYDEGYDNAVPSAVMDRYYGEIAEYLGRRYNAGRGTIVDIGCGDGRFLKAFAHVWPDARGLGVDPALAADEVHADGRVRLVKGVFEDATIDVAPSLFVCRHVLEHIPDPVAFLRLVRSGIGDRAGVPIFVEVPDLEWIVDHDAFWDFCYEHCNYFTQPSLEAAMRRAGFEVLSTQVAFGSQYRWIEAVTAGDATTDVAGDDAARVVDKVTEYAGRERAEIDGARERLSAFKVDGAAVAVWGMATKGIVYTLLVDPDGTLVDAAVDVNTNKQGCFVPTTGRRIESPSVLRRFAGRRVVVLVMNTNYGDEIAAACRELGVDAELVDASGRSLATA